MKFLVLINNHLILTRKKTNFYFNKKNKFVKKKRTFLINNNINIQIGNLSNKKIKIMDKFNNNLESNINILKDISTIPVEIAFKDDNQITQSNINYLNSHEGITSESFFSSNQITKTKNKKRANIKNNNHYSSFLLILSFSVVSNRRKYESFRGREFKKTRVI